MSEKKDNDTECEGIRQYKETAKEVKEIRDLIFKLSGNSGKNQTNLENLTESFKELAKSNSLTHYKLFARTENLKISIAKVETSHVEHVKTEDKEDSNDKHKVTLLLSCVAIGVSVVTVVVLAKQAGLF